MKDHIQGPWRKGAGISDVIVSAEGEYVASVWGRTAEEARARTSMVVAAPEMRELLDFVFEAYMGRSGSTVERQCAIDAAWDRWVVMSRVIDGGAS
ncbi:MAG: hypothetical protein PSX71_13990 [bacterium]|nr:hypothetical protein [bacterium]